MIISVSITNCKCTRRAKNGRFCPGKKRPIENCKGKHVHLCCDRV